MYKKYLIVASKKDKAGINITTNLSQFGNFDFYLCDEEIIYKKNLDLDKINQYDFIIFPSKHKSEKNEKALTVHIPGNWREAQLGGEKGKTCKTSALFQKQMFGKLKENVDRYELKDFKVTMEATHHGPLIEKPCIFIEIGSTETEWANRRAAFIVAKTISDTIEGFHENPYNEIAIAIGGPHYCPNFNKIQLNSNYAISYVIPQYALPLTEEMVKEAVEKTEEDVDFVLLDWKGIKGTDERKRVLDILGKLYLNHKRTSEIEKD